MHIAFLELVINASADPDLLFHTPPRILTAAPLSPLLLTIYKNGDKLSL
jgi:hypothetical protein